MERNTLALRSFSRRDLKDIALRAGWEAHDRIDAQWPHDHQRNFLKRRMRGAILDELRAIAFVDPRRGIDVTVCDPTWRDGENDLLTTADAQPPVDLRFDVQQRIKQLSCQLQRVIVLRYWHGMSGADVARAFGCSEQWSSVLHSRALCALREMMA